jgi:hypothetical protein
MLKVSRYGRTTRVRWLALLLLGSLAWGATAEATHRHGDQLTARAFQLPATILSNSSIAPQTEVSKLDPQGIRSSSSGQCLICQLHQNLSAALFGPTLQIAATNALRVTTKPAGISTLDSLALLHQGRAPPSYL